MAQQRKARGTVVREAVVDGSWCASAKEAEKRARELLKKRGIPAKQLKTIKLAIALPVSVINLYETEQIWALYNVERNGVPVARVGEARDVAGLMKPYCVLFFYQYTLAQLAAMRRERAHAAKKA